MEEKTRKMGVFRRIFFIVGIVLIVLFGTMLVCNLILIVKGFIEPEKPPALFGIVPMAVKSGSMSGDAKDHIELDDLIFIGKADEESLKAGDVIAYLGEDRTVVTHRIVSIEQDEAGQTVFITKGDANNTADAPVERSALIGVYRGRIPKLGGFVMLLQTPVGTALGVGVPILLFFATDLILRKRKKKAE